MADKLRRAGFEVTPPPDCPHGCAGYLEWVDDQYICPVCGDEWMRETVESKR